MYFLVATLLVAFGVAPAAGASTKVNKAESLLRSCLAAMSSERSVHWVSTTNATDSTTRRPATIEITSDAGVASGSQMIVFNEGSDSGTERLELVNRAAYLYGGTYALEKLDGMTAAEARHFEDLWIDVASTSTAFASLAAGLTVSSLRSEVAIASPTLVGLQPVVLGHKTNLLESTTTTNGVQVRTELYLQARGAPLPVEEIVITPGGRTTTTFSSWGESVRVAAPRNSVPLL
jgi:hypothetical protein